MPDVLYSIDMKFKDADKVELVYAIIASRKLENQVVWGSGTAEVHKRAIELDSGIARYFTESQLTRTYFLSLLGCLFCYPLEADVLMAPVMTEA